MTRRATHIRPHSRRTIAVAIFSAITLLVSATPASASNFSSRYADNGSHYYYYYFSLLESYTIEAASWGRDRINYTDMNTYDDGSCKSGTDVCVFDADYTGTWWSTHYGIATCIVTQSGGKCDRFHVQYDTSDLSGYSNTNLHRAGCHEWGHTTGLKHFDSVGGDWTCMWQSIGNSLQSSWYAPHDTSHINGRY